MKLLESREPHKIIETTYLDDRTRAAFRKRLSPKYQVIFDILINTGLQLSEFLNLSEQDIDLDNATLLVRSDESRLIPLNRTATAAFYLWMTKYRGQSELIAIDRKAVEERFRRASQKFGIRITPTICRQTFIRNVFAQTHDLTKTQQLAGHKHLKSTLATCQTNPQALRNAIEKI